MSDSSLTTNLPLSSTKARSTLIAAFSLATFIGAFLLFQLEPLAGKIITPRFGGTAAVWSVCLFFFQVIVLAGYTLTLGISRLGHKKQALIYCPLLLLSIIWSQIPSSASWNASFIPANEPAVQVFCLLLSFIAVPCLILSSVSGMMQIWYSRIGLGNPYPLYSISNIGSLGALLSYPTLFEPSYSVGSMLHIWGYCYIILVALVLSAGFQLFRTKTVAEPETETTAAASFINGRSMLTWIFLSMCGSLVLMTFSAHMTADIAPIPLLWVLPLAVYLISFIIVFANPKFYQPALLTFSWLAVASSESLLNAENNLPLRVVFSLLLVFLLCMLCHGELAASKPGPKQLAKFYFCISLGGMIGGVLVSFIAPLIFPCDVDRWLTIAITIVLTIIVIWQRQLFVFNNRVGTYLLLALFCALIANDACQHLYPDGLIYRERNFYGTVTVRQRKYSVGLYNGRILHGEQYDDPEDIDKPTTYYKQPVAILDAFLRKHSPLNYGIVGLGVGTIAAYGQKGDQIDFFELDPKIDRIAHNYFKFLSHSKAKVNVSLGDGRALLNKLPDKKFDLLFVDAFSGDAIPLHLLTLEAFQIYMSRLKPEGLLVFHLTNRFVDLPPPVAKTAEQLGLSSILIRTKESEWEYLVISRNKSVIADFKTFASAHSEDFEDLELENAPPRPGVTYWTDDFTNLYSVFYTRK